MKLTKKVEAEITQVMNDYWNSYFDGKLEHWGNYLVEDYRNIGGTEEEIWNSKTEILDYTKRIIDQMQGTTELRNKQTQVIPYDPYIMVHELLDIYIKIEEEWTFYQKFRLSSLIQKTTEGWKVLHQHGSYPDSKTTEGEAFAFDTLKSENVKLQKAISERTVELEYKNRELEIEAATERVRVQSMAMQKPNDLEKVNKELLHQLTKLKIEGLSGVSFYFVDEYEIVTVWDLSSPGSMNDPNSYSFKYDSKKFPFLGEFVGILKSTKEEYFVLDFPKEKLLVGIEELKEINITIYEAIKNAVESGALLHQWNPAARITDGILSIDLMKPPDDDTKTILLKMAGAFNQAYTRFLDLQKAEAQAKEAQIETSLERVRAQAMAMRTPEELTGICEVLYAELHTLGFAEIRNAMINIHDDEKETFVNYDYSDEIGKSINYLTYNIHPLIEKQIKEIRNEEGFSETSYTGKDLEDMITFRKNIGEKDDPRIEQADTLYYYFYSIGTGSIGISTFNIVAGEKLEVLKRFRNVFTLAYQRYTDIALAEAQVREAKIEAALERVRARTMAMQKSSDLADTSALLFQQLNMLVPDLWTCGFVLCDRNKTVDEWWLSGGNGFMADLILPNVGDPLHNNIYKAWLNNESYYEEVIDGEPLQQHYQWLMTIPSANAAFNAQRKAGIEQPVWQQLSCAYFSKGYLVVITEKPCGESSIFKRFAQVFEQTYTRFLDLQKAEAQAREAEIELALERVRARTMAMQRSEELVDVATVLFQQVKGLGVPQWNCGFNIWTIGDNEFTYYPGSPDGIISPSPCKIPLTEHPVFMRFDESRKRGDELLIYEKEGEEQANHYRYMLSLPGVGDLLQSMLDAGYELPKFQIDHLANFAYGNLIFITYEHFPKMHDVFKRFAKVFEQTYTRFLDLQKAEAQAREAKIEAAMERTRTQSMIMQHSKELDDSLRVFHEQVLLLGIHSAFSFLWLPDEKNDRHIFWAAWKENNSTIFKSKAINYSLDRNEPSTAQCLVDWRSDEPVYSYNVPPAAVEKYFAVWQELIDGVDHLKPGYFSGGLHYVEAFMKYGCFGVMVVNDITEDEKKILSRFAVEFERTYTRFLDLQKAEAQARDAQIEASLERVRASAMAMHQSTELTHVLSVLFEQFDVLGICPVYSQMSLLDLDTNTFVFRCTGKLGRRIMAHQTLAIDSIDIVKETVEKWKNSEPKSINELYFPNEVIPEIFELFKEIRLATPADALPEIEDFPNGLFVTEGNCKFGYMGFAHSRKATVEEKDIVLKFATEFGRLYQRFLDLQKAEAQAREAQIETGLERVRSRSLAMHHTAELQEVIHTVHKELLHLNIAISGGSFIAINNDVQTALRCWGAGGTADTSEEIILPAYEKPFCTNLINGIKKGPGFFTEAYSQEEKVEFFTFLFKHEPWSNLDVTQQQKTLSGEGGYTRSVCVSQHTSIFIINHFGKIFSEDENEILKRFAKVFEQAYTRFLDLQKAEAQTREAQINLAVERVRARALAMYKSEEILQLVFKLKEEMMNLDIPNVAAATIHLKEDDGNYTMWDLTAMEYADGKLHQPMVVHYRLEEVDPNLFIKRIWENKDPYFLVVQDQKDFKRTIQFLRDNDRKKEADESEAFLKTARIKHAYHPTVPLHHGRMCIDLLEPPSDEIEMILTKMGAAFDLAYKRFEDLKNSEKQLREAQIEASLERVRSRSMGMQKSEELKDVIKIVYQQITHLQINCNHAGFVVDYTPKGDWHFWIADEQDIPGKITHPYFDSVWANQFDKAKEKGVNLFATNLNFEEKNNFYHELLSHVPGLPQASRDYYFNRPGLSASTVLLEDVGLYIENFTPTPYTDEENNILLRFGKVFQQSYTRFLDLQKAEAQAREAKIENALEKARSRTMGMQSSDELPEVANVLFLEIQALGIPAWSCGYNILAADKKSAKCCMSSEGTLQTPFNLRLFGEASFDEMGEFLRSKKTMLVQELGDKALEEHYAYMKSFPDLKSTFDQIGELGLSLPTYQINHLCKFMQGFLLFITYEKVPDAHEIFKRFTKVFEQTYTRFLDLQKAESQTRQAKIETALEKVRARALAMQLPEELIEVAEVLRHEMGLLGVEELETCSIYIHDEAINRTECWYALKDIHSEEKKLVSDHFPLNLNDTWVGNEMKKFYVSDAKQVSILMQGAHRKEWIKYCEERSIPFRGYYGEEIPGRTYHLYKFSHGALGAASAGDISAESWDLLQRAASVFSLAYSRFKDLTQARFDLQRLKEEKQRAETALSELQTTQKQLIQSEKMASLGELTAGIAHEIQNPLNFVNNFSDVSSELLDEMNAEIAKGDFAEAKLIANDIKQNLEKINHHGKRADAIVKGMLQHSRSSSAVKEPTDINALADEYFRLAYHGLRAKDKSFNATMKTDYDETIGNINIIPQDIGRVILNLFTNAFYVVDEKKKARQAELVETGYEPTVSVSTKKVGDKVLISVKDNGPGIPQKILDKIFQPFFTTKPTGQGTGLGLSLSYDIVKAHGGEIIVKTKEGEGSEFIIQLPSA